MTNRYKPPESYSLQKETPTGAGSKTLKSFINLGIATVDQSVSGTDGF